MGELFKDWVSGLNPDWDYYIDGLKWKHIFEIQITRRWVRNGLGYRTSFFFTSPQSIYDYFLVVGLPKDQLPTACLCNRNAIRSYIFSLLRSCLLHPCPLIKSSILGVPFYQVYLYSQMPMTRS